MDCPESKFSMGYVIHNMFFDAFVESKNNKEYKIPVTSTCIAWISEAL
jgi:hypothetical protein